jgi:hypothetical protein
MNRIAGEPTDTADVSGLGTGISNRGILRLSLIGTESSPLS